MTVGETDHVLVVVGDRRWCLCCELFQMRRPPADWPWLKACPRTTVFAQTMNPAQEHPHG